MTSLGKHNADSHGIHIGGHSIPLNQILIMYSIGSTLKRKPLPTRSHKSQRHACICHNSWRSTGVKPSSWRGWAVTKKCKWIIPSHASCSVESVLSLKDLWIINPIASITNATFSQKKIGDFFSGVGNPSVSVPKVMKFIETGIPKGKSVGIIGLCNQSRVKQYTNHTEASLRLGRKSRYSLLRWK